MVKVQGLRDCVYLLYDLMDRRASCIECNPRIQMKKKLMRRWEEILDR